MQHSRKSRNIINLHKNLFSGVLLGFPCATDSQCMLRVENSFCTLGLCQCSQGYVPYKRNKCLPGKKYILSFVKKYFIFHIINIIHTCSMTYIFYL